MNWYLAKVIFKIKGTGSSMTQFDEHLRLIQAEDFESAFRKAKLIGIREEDQFFNDRLEPVKWEFVNVAELLPLQGLTDGLELYSQIHETSEACHYIRAVHSKAAALHHQ